LLHSAKTPRTKTKASRTKASPVDNNPSKAASRPTRDLAARDRVRLGSRAASKVGRVASKVGNRASRSNSADRAKVALSSSKDSKVAPDRGKAVLARAAKVRAAKVARVNQVSRNSLASRALVARSSNKVEPDRAASDKVAKGVRAESVRADQAAKANPSSSAGRAALAATRKSNRVDSKAVLAKAGLARVAQDQVDRVSPSNSARALAAARDNRVFPDNKAFPSKVAQGRKACPVSRARPINSATEAQPLVRQVHE